MAGVAPGSSGEAGPVPASTGDVRKCGGDAVQSRLEFAARKQACASGIELLGILPIPCARTYMHTEISAPMHAQRAQHKGHSVNEDTAQEMGDVLK